MNGEIEVKMMDYFELAFRGSHIPQAIISIDLVFLEVNQAFCGLVGLSSKEIIGLAMKDLKSRNIVKYLKDSGETFQDAIREKRVTHGQSSIETKAGSFVIERANTPLMEGNELNYVMIIYNDITRIVKVKEYMANEIKKMSDVYGKAADGNLTIRYKITEADGDTQDAFDELVILRDVMDGVIADLRESVVEIQKGMESVNEMIKSSAASITEISNAVVQLSTDSVVVSGDIGKAKRSTEDILKGMGDMSTAISDISVSVTGVSGQSEDMKEASHGGLDLTRETKDATDGIVTSNDGVIANVEEMDKKMLEVGKLVKVIQDIASQTNLLALNAAIEAARAGEAGRGFAVVAAEVKALSQDSRKSAENISDIVNDLGASIKHVREEVIRTKEVVGKGSTLATDSFETFKSIVSVIDSMANQISSIAAGTEEEAAAVEEITASIHEINLLLESVDKASTNTAASTEEVSASIAEITRNMEHISKVSGDVLESIKKFKV
ncbi:methyl-accepting chemotaxis protein [bacterium]|nr:methyl-accepting chemotaxis protein [bacterium]